MEVPTASIDALRRLSLPATTKGVPLDGRSVLGVPAHRPRIFDAGVPTPFAVIDSAAFEHNVATMASWCARHDLELAPHVKTSMSPELVARQLAAGAWGVTVATAAQARVVRELEVDRIVIANEIVDPVAVRWIAQEVTRYPSLELLLFVDSEATVRLLDRELAVHGLDRGPGTRLGALVEIGHGHGRAGARSSDLAVAVGRAVDGSARLRLAGVAAFEGLFVVEPDGAARARRFLDHAVQIARDVRAATSLADSEPMIVSAGGSAYFDLVLDSVREGLGSQVRVLLRSGCYALHDDGLYAATSPWGSIARGDDSLLLRSALTVWAHVISRPEPDFAVADAGKRDLAFDVGLPIPRWRWRRGEREPSPLHGAEVVALSDQHAHLRVPPDVPLDVGDRVGLGISHPCSLMDRWRSLLMVDDHHRVVDVVHTWH